MFWSLLGGIGFFLLGMALMTQGMQAAAGDALRSLLTRFTRGTGSALTTGAVFTLIVQSSSITTLATIGFVSAGLLTFGQSIGVILGANLGTTATSWLVALIGFKVKIESFALPLVGAGALLHLFTKGRKSHLGLMLAGFGLLFVGIDQLQLAMADVGERFSVDQFVSPGLWGRIVLLLFGMVMTVVMQSSSAAVATTLAALHTGTIGLEDAAAVVIGQNVGTTVKALIGAMGASLPAKRTAAVHLIFNLTTGVIAFLLLPLFVWSVDAITEWAGSDDDAVSLAAFHTVFNLVGVLVFYPFVGRLARFVERMLPERHTSLTWRLRDQASSSTEVALEAARVTIAEVVGWLVDRVRGKIEGNIAQETWAQGLIEARQAVDEVWAFVAAQRGDGRPAEEMDEHLSVVHALDHLTRWLRLLEGEQLDRLIKTGGMQQALALYGDQLQSAASLAQKLAEPDPATRLEQVRVARELSVRMATTRKTLRQRWLQDIPAGAIAAEEAGDRLLLLHWLDGSNYHIWRLTEHLLMRVREQTGGAQGEAKLLTDEHNPARFSEGDDPG